MPAAGGVPPLVQSAADLAARVGFGHSSVPEVGRLLATLVAHERNALLAEAGTGCGVGAAWMASCMGPTSRLVTVESDGDLAAAASGVLASAQNVEVTHGDWRDVLPERAPFDLLFLDGGRWKQSVERDGVLAVGMLRDGGLLVVDDMSPVHRPLPAWLRGRDPVRDFLHGRADLSVTEVSLSETTGAILALRTARPAVPGD